VARGSRRGDSGGTHQAAIVHFIKENTVYQGHVVFKALAERMDELLTLDVEMFLDIRRPAHDHSSPSELVRRFAERFTRQEWPGRRLPSLYYDPRSLEAEPAKRASLHAKCIVIDQDLALVSSANFTEAGQTKNLEVGVQLRSPSFARRLTEHFETLASKHVLRRVSLTTS
jgi:phosphatidylserine/phosphatidylglycerophosphate/cardiolipin synthase-like enzyme